MYDREPHRREFQVQIQVSDLSSATVSNFRMQPGRFSTAGLMKGIQRGFYVTGMMGFGFDATTGNFSRGASGYLIENGEIG